MLDFCHVLVALHFVRHSTQQVETPLRAMCLPLLQIAYVTVASNFVRGVRLNGKGTLLAKFAGAGYQQVGPASAAATTSRLPSDLSPSSCNRCVEMLRWKATSLCLFLRPISRAPSTSTSRVHSIPRWGRSCLSWGRGMAAISTSVNGCSTWGRRHLAAYCPVRPGCHKLSADRFDAFLWPVDILSGLLSALSASLQATSIGACNDSAYSLVFHLSARHHPPITLW